MTSTEVIGAIFRSNGFSRRLIVTFDALHASNHARQNVSGDRVVLACEADHLNIGCTDAGWYQSQDIFEVLEETSRICRRYEDVILYGSSMGAYAALLLSGALQATNVVALAPQFSIDPQMAPYETRFLDYAKHITFRYDRMWETASKFATKHVLFDPFCDIDRQHVERIKLLRNVKTFPIYFSGHYPGQFLLEAGILKQTIIDLILNRPNERERRRRVRQGRRSSHRYFVERAFYTARRGQIREALGLVDAAYVLAPNQVSVLETYHAILSHDSAYYGLSHAMIRLVLKEYPDWRHYDGTLANVWRELNQRTAPLIRKLDKSPELIRSV